MSNIDDIKNEIRDSINSNSQIPTIIGDISIEKQIGEGGNSLVYKADLSKRQVALKIHAINYKLEKNTEKYKRYIDEFCGLLPLSGFGLTVPIYYFGLIEEKYPFFIMELFNGTLDSWIKNNSVENIQYMVPIIKKLLNCLNFIHNYGIIHRDIKPKNIFIKESGELILGDFGIAWFDPEHYEKLAHTSKGDRLANYGFSAPEQFQKDCIPSETMDIYAIGQIIQWMITGNPHSGTNRRLLSSVHDSFGVLDQLVERLLSFDPKHRPQSATEALNLLMEFTESQNISRNIINDWGNVNEFASRLGKFLPGKRHLIEISDKKRIDELLELLSIEPQKYELWWTRGLSNFQIEQIKKQPEGFWLLNQYEFQIQTIWVYRHPSAIYKDFVLIKTIPMKSFGIDKNTSTIKEIAGYFNGHYILPEEAEDGYATIEGKVVEIDSYVEPRCREFQIQYYFLGARTSNILYRANDEIVQEVYQSLLQKGFITEYDIEKLNKTKRDPVLID